MTTVAALGATLGCHANMGAHMCAENGTWSAAHLDLRKVFDHVSHDAALRAMKEVCVRRTLFVVSPT